MSRTSKARPQYFAKSFAHEDHITERWYTTRTIQSMLDLYHSILDASPRAKNGIQLNDIQGGHLRILRGNRGKFDQVRSQIGGGYDSCQGQCSKASDCSRAVFGVWGGPAVLVLAGLMSFSYNQKEDGGAEVWGECFGCGGVDCCR